MSIFKRTISIGIIIMLLVGITGCITEEDRIEYNQKRVGNGLLAKLVDNNERLLPTGKNHLYYDNETFIVYYYFVESIPSQGYGFMSPFYSENGKLVKFNMDNNEFEDIN